MSRDHFFYHLGTRRPHDLPSDGRSLLSERLEEATSISLRLKNPLRPLKPEDIVGRLGPLMSMQLRPLVQKHLLNFL